MDFKSEVKSCSCCNKLSYPDNDFEPFVCYNCQWDRIVQNPDKELSIETLCYSCKIPITTYTLDLLCESCHFKSRIHEVHPGVFISDGYISTQYDFLKSLGIKQILTVAKELKQHNQSDFKTMYISIDDDPDENIMQYFDQAHEFISKAPTLVHCFAGISRSASIVIAYVMKVKQLHVTDAIKQCKKIRSIIDPNEGFVKQLHDYNTYLGN